jgi:hypothetical protein
VDISNPEAPEIVGSVDTPFDALEVAIAGVYAYVANYPSGLAIVNISNPEAPALVGSVDTPGHATGVAVAGSYAYVADNYSAGLQIAKLCTACTDTDEDGLCDGEDNCPYTANADQADTDGDGIGDVCDTCMYDADNDADEDGVCGDVDNCPYTANADQADVDGEGIGDVCDNCPDVANADQLDTDDDSLGDACDVCPFDPDNDVDGDGVCGNVDACPYEDSTGFDANSDGCIDRASGLIDIVNTLPDDILSDETKNSLVSKVDAAMKSIDKEKDEAAVNQLNAFINEIEAQRGKKVSDEAADMLIQYALNIIAQVAAW